MQRALRAAAATCLLAGLSGCAALEQDAAALNLSPATAGQIAKAIPCASVTAETVAGAFEAGLAPELTPANTLAEGISQTACAATK